MLLAKGASPELTDTFNKTASDYALEADKMQVVELLKASGKEAPASP